MRVYYDVWGSASDLISCSFALHSEEKHDNKTQAVVSSIERQLRANGLHMPSYRWDASTISRPIMCGTVGKWSARNNAFSVVGELYFSFHLG